MKRFAIPLLLLAGMCAGPAAHAQAPAEPVQLMVLGTYHFANPGRDVHNVEADDVLQPRRQRELQALTDALLRFRPTRVMVEAQVASADLAMADYAEFDSARLASERNETVQIGYRLAHAAGLRAVQGIDEQPGEGEPDYFPFGALQESAARHGQQAVIAGAMAPVQREVEDFSRRQASATVAELLATLNGPEAMAQHRSGYYGVLGIGDNDAQAGADLNAMWYLRNAKIFAKLMHAARPGDRIVVVFGAGHAYWLRHFAAETPGYTLVDPLPYLLPSR